MPICAPTTKRLSGSPGPFVAAAFVADLDRLLVKRASCSVAEVEERFEPVEAVQQLGGAAAAGKELHQRAATSPTEFVARIHHGPQPPPW